MKQMISDEPRFIKWAKDQPLKPYPTDDVFERWQALGWVRPAEEGWALTTKGRSVASKRTEEETGWLIERARDGSALWLTLNCTDHLYEWTSDSADALRFARAIDAQRFGDSYVDGPFRVTDHLWMDVIQQEPPRPLTSAELEEMFRQPETADQIVERISLKLREEMRAILKGTVTASDTSQRVDD